MNPIIFFNSSASWTSFDSETDEDAFSTIMTVISVALGAVVVIDRLVKKAQSTIDYKRLLTKQEECAKSALEKARVLGDNKTLPEAWGQQLSCFIKIVHEKSSKTEDVWQDDEVIKAADNLMALAYAASKALLDQTSSQQISRSELDILFYLPVSYHAARGYCTTKEAHNDWGKSLKLGLYVSKDQIPEYHRHLFYIDGEIFNEWRLLFNKYASELREKIPDMCDDPRLVAWTKPDLDMKKFLPIPDTLPGANCFF